ncbi:MAG: DUF885 domain-containing protein [Bacteroidales bacterium]|nr:DUF885 domain-containing protein [Bacteroidales bacterium]MDT8432726.1 DUF885 domain-containing protein [Bacteroidales bacterium]
MKRIFFYLLSVSLILASCNREKSGNTVSNNQMDIDSLFESYYQERLALNPLTATSVGDSRYDSFLVDFLSEENRQKFMEFYLKYEDLCIKYNVENLDESQLLGLKLILYNCQLMREGLGNKIQLVESPPYWWPEFVLMPINQFSSFDLYMGQLASGQSIQPFNTVEDYENWLQRIEDYLEWINSAILNMKEGMMRNITQPRIIMDRVIEQLEGINANIDNHLFYTPIKLMPESFSEKDSIRMEELYRKMVENKIGPTYDKLLEFLKNEYLPACREEAGLGSVPGGLGTYEYLIKYHTSTNMTADEIFELGQSEVSRIMAEMECVKSQVGYEGDLKGFFDFVRTNKELMPFTEAVEVIDHFNSIHERMKPHLDELFDLKPKTGFEVMRTEGFREKTASPEYVPGSPDGSRNGIFYVPLPDVKSYNIFYDEDLFLHEAIPGHHYQISIQQENQQLPTFQRIFVESNAYIEGWALYTESLGKELGLLEDPYQYFGMLTMDLHRAIRLVLDVGIHVKGWTREEAIQYSLDHEALSEAEIIAEVERYMVIPGQALSYKIGQVKIRDLRIRAESELGNKFDIKEFHNQILDSGSIPLVLLEEKIDRWIQKTI